MSSKRALLAERLFSKTKAGELNWQETADENVYQVAFPGYALHIGEREFEDEPYIFIRLYNADGALMEDFDDGDLRNDVLPAGQASFYGMMLETYNSARRVAMGVERALDKILEELGGP